MNLVKPELSFNGTISKRTITNYIILHHAAGYGTVYSVHKYHKEHNGWKGIAYNFYIEKDGTIYDCRGFDGVGGHTTSYNNNSIGICLEGNFTTGYPTKKQIESCKELLKECKRRYPDAKIIRHCDVNQTACPGNNFPFNDILKYNEEETPTWAKEACQWCIDNGLIKGDADGYRWNDTITRAEIAVFIYRMYKKYLDK